MCDKKPQIPLNKTIINLPKIQTINSKINVVNKRQCDFVRTFIH